VVVYFVVVRDLWRRGGKRCAKQKQTEIKKENNKTRGEGLLGLRGRAMTQRNTRCVVVDSEEGNSLKLL
jgi:hypothetical protein